MASPPDPIEREQIWRKYDRMEVRLSAPLSRRMLDLARVGPGMRVLDLATGRGEPAIPAAHRVGPTGSVVGVDVAERMLAMARERAVEEGVQNLELRAMSAEALDPRATGAPVDVIPAGQFDVVLARWGLMFMDHPVAALAGARRALRSDGTLVAALWAEPERVPWFSLPRRALQKYRPVPPIDDTVPGVFFYADPARFDGDLRRAGFEPGQLEELDVVVMEASSPSELVAWVRAFGMTPLLADLPEATQRAWERDFVRDAEPLRKDGMFQLGGVTRIAVARPSPLSEPLSDR